MCGIAGIVGQNNKQAVELMLAASLHRGPDDSGIWQAPEAPICLGHTRLSILDLSPAGRQPMSSQDRRLTIVFNGEIYNFQDLREELEAAGYRFFTATDTEVVLNAYHCWGEACLERFRGMFAFALAEQTPDGYEVFFARDRIGIKPLVYYESKGTLWFASEVRTLLAANCIPRRLNPQALFDCLAYGAVVQPRTIIENIRMLDAGCVMRWKNGRLSGPQRWCRLPEEIRHLHEELQTSREANIEERLRFACQEAARYHLVSDVPVGVFLSGGVDSTIVAALMSRQTNGAVKSFFVGFESKYARNDETRFARLAAEHIGTEHHEVILSDADALGIFESFVDRLDQPSEDGANTMIVAELARQEVKVVLSGLGADEIFAGYDSIHRQVQRLSGLPGMFSMRQMRGLLAMDALLPNKYSAALIGAMLHPNDRYAYFRQHIPIAKLRSGLRHELLAEMDTVDFKASNGNGLGSLNSYLMQEINGYLKNTLLRDSDNLTMASSIELRPLFLDYEIIRLGMAVPGHLKINGKTGKAILKRSFDDLLPDPIRFRKKQGFGLPKDEWINGPLRETYGSILASKLARDLFSHGWLRKEQKRLQRRKVSWTAWTVATLLEWMRTQRVTV